MDITIDRESSLPIYRQIVDRIREMILSGDLAEGFRLPPERQLATSLKVNRSTVLAAYRELKGLGLVGAHVGRGTVVMAPAPQVARQALPWRNLFRESATRTRDPVLRDLLEQIGRQDAISLSIGLPAPELLPMAALQEIFEELFAEIGPPLVQHCPSEGVTQFRESLSEWCTSCGISCQPGEVLVLSGSQQGIDIAARVFLDPGDTVVVEEPTYVGVLPVLRAAQARIVGVPVDTQGMRTDLLATVLERHRPKLIYTMPTFQNPSGAQLSRQRRQHLLELAYRHQIPIIEDDPYSLLRYDGEPIPSLKALDERGHVIYLSTFSKVLFPGLRTGLLVAPRPVVHQFALAKQTIDLHASSVAQYLLDRFLRQERLGPHLKTVCAAYARRRNVMGEALAEFAPPGLEWHQPAGGFYFWCRLPAGINTSRLLAQAGEAGVLFLPGRFCFASDDGADFIRLNFSYPNSRQIRDGVARLMEVVRQTAAQVPGPGWQEPVSRPVV